MSFSIALTGLRAAQDDLAVTGNNIANAGTVGFKRSRAEFADIFTSGFSGVNSNSIGAGVRLADVAQQFSQGNVEFTGNSLDLAINGGGFYALRDPSSDAQVYSRAGNFQVDREGNVVSPTGQRLQVFDVVDPAVPSFNTAALSDLQLPSGQGEPQATTELLAAINLDSGETDLGVGAIDPTDPDTFSFSSSATMFDSLGVSHTATFYFRKTGPQEFNVRLVLDGDNAQTPTEVTLNFDADGQLTTPMPLQMGVDFGGAFAPGNGANPIDAEIDFTDLTAFGSPSVTNAVTQDGFTVGRLSSVEISEEGIVFARFTNGQANPVGQVALANFANAQGLSELGNNVWAQTFDSGEAVLGSPGAGGRGGINSGALEASNVEIEEQLVNLILAQRNFQANAQTISTADTINQTIINL
jgi:flagellar hook protein FlgE